MIRLLLGKEQYTQSPADKLGLADALAGLFKRLLGASMWQAVECSIPEADWTPLHARCSLKLVGWSHPRGGGNGQMDGRTCAQIPLRVRCPKSINFDQ